MRFTFAIYAVALLLVAVSSSFAPGVSGRVAFGISVLWAVSSCAAFFKRIWGYYACTALLAALLLYIVAGIIGRIVFVATHGDFDCATCDGSPMAFILGTITSIGILIPGILILRWLWKNRK